MCKQQFSYLFTVTLIFIQKLVLTRAIYKSSSVSFVVSYFVAINSIYAHNLIQIHEKHTINRIWRLSLFLIPC